MSRSSRILGLLVLCLCAMSSTQAQSTDIASPSPVSTTEVASTIGARDIGDPRLTDHYYAFTGTPGDLLITVDTRNLNGDVDVFTSSGLRPLLKFTIYASNSAPITKSIYLRKREDLILRIEARTPNDDEGTYRLHFSGSFEPITGGPFLAEMQPAPVEESPVKGQKGRRVSSVGARINEPPPAEVAAAPTPEPTPAESPSTLSPPAATTEAKPVESPKAAKVVAPRAPPRNARARRDSTRRTRTPPAPKVEETVANTEPAARLSDEEPISTPASGGRRSTKKGGTARRTATEETRPEPSPAVESGPRLIIETNDGTLINRFMSSVRRITVENGQVVVVGQNGKTERIALASVLRMSIAP